jgi:hypothetical protein
LMYVAVSADRVFYSPAQSIEVTAIWEVHDTVQLTTK